MFIDLCIKNRMLHTLTSQEQAWTVLEIEYIFIKSCNMFTINLNATFI